MRMRARSNLQERLEKCAFLLADEEFLARRPMRLEIGCGKGGFICACADSERDTAFLAVERAPNVAVLALEKAKALALSNLRFMLGDAALLADALPERFAEVIYLNFSDPWPKRKSERRRLTHAEYLSLYKRLLTERGEIHMKTDNKALFEYSLKTLDENGFEIRMATWDLHSEFPDGNIMTEYEARFLAQGIKINKLIAAQKNPHR